MTEIFMLNVTTKFLIWQCHFNVLSNLDNCLTCYCNARGIDRGKGGKSSVVGCRSFFQGVSHSTSFRNIAYIVEYQHALHNNGSLPEKLIDRRYSINNTVPDGLFLELTQNGVSNS